MSCEKCSDLCVRFPIMAPRDLQRAIEIAKENLADGVIVEIGAATGRLPFPELVAAGPWDDIVEYRFRCNTCSEVFSLHAETYHGSGGYWEPENKSSIRENL